MTCGTAGKFETLTIPWNLGFQPWKSHDLRYRTIAEGYWFIEDHPFSHGIAMTCGTAITTPYGWRNPDTFQPWKSHDLRYRKVNA